MVGSQSAYARYRKERGLSGGSRRAVQKALASKRIMAGADGKIDFERADHDWEANLNRHKSPAGRKSVKSKPAALEASPDVPLEILDGAVIPDGTFLEAQRRHEWLKVEKEEMELRKRREELFERSEVEAKWGELLKRFQSRMLSISDELAPRLAVVSDVLECRAMIEREVREVLLVLGEYQADAA